MDGASNTTLDCCAELADGSQILRMGELKQRWKMGS
jgi:hypothetical protein